MSDEQLRIIANMTVELTKLKMREVPNLCVENFASECFLKLIQDFLNRDYILQVGKGNQ